MIVLAVEKRLLTAIRKHNGEWTWYQLANFVDQRDMPPELNQMKILKSFIDQKWIEEREGSKQGQPRYVITELGAKICGEFLDATDL